MSLRDFAVALESTPLSASIKTTSWLVPLLQAIHIVMIGVVFGSMLLVTLRILGLMRADEPLERVWRRFAPFFWSGFTAMALTGLVLTLGEPVRELMSLSYRLKMLLLAVCIAGAAAFGRYVGGAARDAEPAAAAAAAPPAGAPAPAAIRITAVAALALWLAIVFLGRAIAYDVPVWGDWSPGRQAAADQR